MLRLLRIFIPQVYACIRFDRRLVNSIINTQTHAHVYLLQTLL